ncbi:LysM peptidoglycan-binding domain-containing M23 family metallopeptidase [Treponema sp.]|uniref:LysM peptidoglycan-binding domain-containing M23 family metallopeptidase n=1 Tax=Treponema sp. TaxID=166 RepID=UPI003EFC400F
MKKNKIEFSDDICYIKLLKMKSYLKLALMCGASISGIALFIVGITFGVVHFKNSSGQGGFESASHISGEIFQGKDMSVQADGSLDGGLSYVSYRVKKGDMISFIADEFGVTQDTIISVNNIHASRLIQIGQYLKIPSMPGILYTVREDGETVETISEKYKVDALTCSSVNHLELTEKLSAGKSLFVPYAELDWITRQEINGDLFTKPIHSRFYYSSMFGWRASPFDSSKRTFHGGIDMACAKGTSIYAALPGKVSVCGWSDVYGNYVIISHHSGYKTLYGHMNEILVRKGQAVDTGTRIGKVGNTGMSTGPHLHFTVYKNGRSINPANLWK